MRLLLYKCQCGWLLRAPDEAQLVAAVQGHIVTAHGLSLTRAQVLALSERVDPRPAQDNADETHNE
jgi:hypothetical protein